MRKKQVNWGHGKVEYILSVKNSNIQKFLIKTHCQNHQNKKRPIVQLQQKYTFGIRTPFSTLLIIGIKLNKQKSRSLNCCAYLRAESLFKNLFAASPLDKIETLTN